MERGVKDEADRERWAEGVDGEEGIEEEESEEELSRTPGESAIVAVGEDKCTSLRLASVKPIDVLGVVFLGMTETAGRGDLLPGATVIVRVVATFTMRLE